MNKNFCFLNNFDVVPSVMYARMKDGNTSLYRDKNLHSQLPPQFLIIENMIGIYNY